MITLRIGAEHRTISNRSEIDEQWVTQQVNRRRADGQLVCVAIQVRSDGIDLSLATPGCGPGGGGGRPPRPQEHRIIELWRMRGLSSTDFSGGNVVAFMHQLLRLLN